MKRQLRFLQEWALMILISAFLFAALFRLNEALFSALEYSDGINWLFLPAGFRILLVLLLGLPGALGIMLGNLWLDHADLDASHWPQIALSAIVSGLTPWLIRVWLTARGWFDGQLSGITGTQLLNFIVLYAGLNALANQAIRWVFHMANSMPWIDVWPMFVGDLAGACVVLYAFKFSLPMLRQLMHKRA